MKAFRAKGGNYTARLNEVEREVVGQLAADVAELLGATPAQLAEALGADDDGASGPGQDGDPWDLPGLADPLAALSGAAAAPLDEPEDLAVRRLLPTASDDPEIADEFRRLVQPDLRQLKIARLLALVTALRRGDRLVVPADRADLLSGALVDIRLVLAERLDISTDEAADELYTDLERAATGDGDDSGGAGEPASPTAAVRLHLGSAYAALTWLQESLVTVQLAALDEPDA